MNAQNPYSAADIVISAFRDKKLFVYLVQLKVEHFQDQWSLPGALVNEDENLDATATRVFIEATASDPAYIEQLYTFSNPDRDPRSRSISTAYLTFPTSMDDFQPCEKYSDGKWFDTTELPKLAYDHNQILDTAFERIGAKLNYSTIAFSLLPTEFTLTELQDLYEHFSAQPLDKRNFRKKILSLDIVKATGTKRQGEKARPAELYTAKSKDLKLIPLFK